MVCGCTFDMYSCILLHVHVHVRRKWHFEKTPSVKFLLRAISVVYCAKQYKDNTIMHDTVKEYTCMYMYMYMCTIQCKCLPARGCLGVGGRLIGGRSRLVPESSSVS